MDLESFIGNRELLERLSQEYELLKVSGADVDYAAWVRQRLREAAAELVGATVGGKVRSGDIQRDDSYGIQAVGAALPVAASEQNALDGQSLAEPSVITPPEQLAFTRRLGPAAPSITLPPALDEAAAIRAKPELAWFLRGEGAGPASGALAAAIYGPSAQGPGMPTSSLARPAKASRSKSAKRVVVISPRKSPPQHASPKKQQQQQSALAAPPVSKLYTHVEPGLFSVRPDAYVHAQARTRRTQSAAMRPDWVNAASLQAALRGASSAIPHLQAAADRERRLALSTALARQTLAAGLNPDEARAMVLHGTLPTITAAQAAQYDHVLQVAQQLAQQNEQLAMAVQLNSAQLAQQQAILESALQHQQAPGPAATADDRPVSAGPTVPQRRVEVESGPPPWFIRKGSQPAALDRQGKRGALVERVGKGSHDNTITSTVPAKSSKKAGTRSRSPAVHVGPGSATMSTSASATAMTAKERERMSRKDALKALLKQVLGGAGLSGGQKGRWRLASSMVEAEKLVEAIHALARNKAGSDGAGDEEAVKVPSVVRPTTAAETQTSGRPSVASAGSNGNAAPVEAVTSRPPPRVTSLLPSYSGTSSAEAASTDAAFGPRSHPLPRRGSGLASGSEPHSAAGAEVGSSKGATPPEAASREVSPEATEDPGPAVPFKAVSKKSLGMEGSAKEASSSHTPPSSLPRETSVRAASLDSSAEGQRSRTAAGLGSSAQVPVPTQAQAPPGPAAGPGVTTSGPTGPQMPKATAAAGGSARSAMPLQGFMVESLEDQVQRIVEQDAAAAAEMVRAQKLDTLEQRLQSMVDRVETKLARVLQPLHFNAQQLLHQQVAPGAWPTQRSTTATTTPHASRGPADGSAGAVPAARAAGEASLSAIAAAVAAAAGARPGQGVPGGGVAAPAAGQRSAGVMGGVHTAGVDYMSPRSAGMSVLELQRMLIELNRMESKEQEIRRKWLLGSKATHRQHGRAPQAIVVRDAQMGTLDLDNHTIVPRAPPSPPSGRAENPKQIHRSTPQPPTESALAIVAADTFQSAVSGPGSRSRHDVAVGGGGHDVSSVQAQDGTAAADETLTDPISDATLESVLQSRRRFLRAQKLADGDLMAAAHPSINPVQIMEDLTDVLLDEILHEQARELAGFCDSLGEHMVKDEFDLPDDDDKTR